MSPRRGKKKRMKEREEQDEEGTNTENTKSHRRVTKALRRLHAAGLQHGLAALRSGVGESGNSGVGVMREADSLWSGNF